MRAISPDPRRDHLARLAADPRIVPEVHHVCDGWCEHCALTERCLAFRCRRERRRTGGPTSGYPSPPATVMLDPRDRPRPDGEWRVDRSPWESWPGEVDTDADQALATLALDYARRSPRYVERVRRRGAGVPRSRALAPADVILRHRSSIYFRTTRALVGRALAAAGRRAWANEAHSSAARAISCSLRSHDALGQYAQDEERDALVGLLDAVMRGLIDRFPAAEACRLQCLQRAAGALKATAGGPSAKFDIGHAEVARRR